METISEEGEVLAGGLATLGESRLVLEMQKAEISQQVATAKQFPRSIKRVSTNILDLATLDEKAAEECIYSLPRGGKPIVGPSIRLAEIVAGQWGNCRDAARVVDVNRGEGYVEAEGVFHDLETNRATLARVRRSIKGRNGKVFTDDMILVTGNAAGQIARRNAILAGVPKAVWRKAYDAAEHVIKGDVQTLVERRGRAIAAFARFGVKPEQIFAVLNVAGEEEIGLDHLPMLHGMFSAIKSQEATVEEIFSPRQAGGAFQRIANPLADDEPETPAGKLAATTREAAVLASGPMADQMHELADKLEGGTKPRGHATEYAHADEIVGRDGTLLKARDGEAGGTVEPIPYARERGGQAFRNRMQRKAIPPEYRDEGRQAEAQAWLDGFDQAKAAAAEAKASPAPQAEGSADGNA